MSEIPDTIKSELKRVQQSFKDAWIAQNLITNEYFIAIFPITICNSMFIKKVEL